MKLENDYTKQKHSIDRDKIGEKLDHEQRKAQTLETDLNDYAQ